MADKPCIFCGGACGRVCRGLGFKSSKNETDNRSAGRKPDKSPSRIAAPVDARHSGFIGGNPNGEVQAAITSLKRGRPRIGEIRAKPWLDCVPPMSKTTYYRRQKEQKK
jgi:hypothetical protein